MADMHLGEFLEIIEKYFSKIAGPDLIMESVDNIGSIIATFLSEDKPKRYSSVIFVILICRITISADVDDCIEFRSCSWKSV